MIKKNNWRFFFTFSRDLLDHYDDIVLRSNTRLNMLEDCYSEIINYLGVENSPPPDYFVEVYGRVVINSFNVLDVRDQVCTAIIVT